VFPDAIGKQAELADADQAGGQDMQQEAAQKLASSDISLVRLWSA
jgi:hypothetical protein